MDHVVPWEEGGRDDVSNFVPACRRCNSSKKNRTVLRWKRDIQARPPSDLLASFFGGKTYHDPDLVIDSTPEGLIEHVESVQAEVCAAFRRLEVDLAEGLMGEMNRLAARMGNLSTHMRALVHAEFLLRLGEQEVDLASRPSDRYLRRIQVDRRQADLVTTLAQVGNLTTSQVARDALAGAKR